MSLKSRILKLYYWGNLPKDTIDANQKRIRTIEWNAIQAYIPTGSSFLDVGCGAGYAMKKAMEVCNCQCYGLDPIPGEHGVGRYNTLDRQLNIQVGVAEDIFFSENMFDVVYSSHVLEHVGNELLALQEMNRVLKDDGILIIGMPTAAMAHINNITQIMFTTHQRIFNVLLGWFPFIHTGKTKWINILIPCSHSFPRAKTIFYDMYHYRISNWKKIVEQVFDIKEVITPALYPYPEYKQWFSLKENARHSSSVFFICKKK